MSDDSQVQNQKETDELIAKFDRESNTRRFTGIRSYIVTGLLLLFAAYVFWTTLIVTLPEQVRRSAFVGILVFIGYLLFPAKRSMTRRENHVAWYDIVLGCL